MENLYTIQQVADYLKVSKVSVYNYIKKGLMKPIRFEGSTRISESQIGKFLSKQNKD